MNRLQDMNEHDAFLDAIVSAPDDDFPRLQYADWLEERGDADRAEFIRLQLARDAQRPKECLVGECRHGCPEEWCEIASRAWRREHELLGQYQGSWTTQMLNAIPTLHRSPLLQVAARDATRVGKWPSDDAMFRFRRGFVEQVTLFTTDWLAHGPSLVRAAPIREVRLSDKEPSASGSRWRWVCVNPGMRTRPRTMPLGSNELPRMWFDKLKGDKPGNWHYDTPTAAHADLSRVVLAWARSKTAPAPSPSAPRSARSRSS